MSLYTQISAENICIAVSAGIEFKIAAAAASETIVQLIKGKHQGQITTETVKTLSLEELRKGSGNAAVLGAARICPKSVPPEVMKQVEAALK
jgi:hypothetical protein